jgi:hypothetical protein
MTHSTDPAGRARTGPRNGPEQGARDTGLAGPSSMARVTVTSHQPRTPRGGAERDASMLNRVVGTLVGLRVATTLPAGTGARTSSRRSLTGECITHTALAVVVGMVAA